MPDLARPISTIGQSARPIDHSRPARLTSTRLTSTHLSPKNICPAPACGKSHSYSNQDHMRSPDVYPWNQASAMLSLLQSYSLCLAAIVFCFAMTPSALSAGTGQQSAAKQSAGKQSADMQSADKKRLHEVQYNYHGQQKADIANVKFEGSTVLLCIFNEVLADFVTIRIPAKDLVQSKLLNLEKTETTYAKWRRAKLAKEAKRELDSVARKKKQTLQGGAVAKGRGSVAKDRKSGGFRRAHKSKNADISKSELASLRLKIAEIYNLSEQKVNRALKRNASLQKNLVSLSSKVDYSNMPKLHSSTRRMQSSIAALLDGCESTATYLQRRQESLASLMLEDIYLEEQRSLQKSIWARIKKGEKQVATSQLQFDELSAGLKKVQAQQAQLAEQLQQQESQLLEEKKNWERQRSKARLVSTSNEASHSSYSSSNENRSSRNHTQEFNPVSYHSGRGSSSSNKKTAGSKLATEKKNANESRSESFDSIEADLEPATAIDFLIWVGGSLCLVVLGFGVFIRKARAGSQSGPIAIPADRKRIGAWQPTEFDSKELLASTNSPNPEEDPTEQPLAERDVEKMVDFTSPKSNVTTPAAAEALPEEEGVVRNGKLSALDS